MKKNKVVALGIATSLMAFASACGGEDASASDSELVIGVLLDSSGSASYYSNHTLVGIEMAVDELNSKGGIDGKKIKLTKADDQNDPNQAPLKAQTLIQDGAHAILTISGSSSALQIKPVVKQRKIVTIAVNNLNPTITEAPDQDYMFATSNSTSQVVEVLQDALRGYPRVGILTDTSATGAGLAKSYQDAIKAAGSEVVATEAVDIGATDATAQVARVRSKNPDTIFLALSGAPEQALYVRELSEQGETAPVFMDNTGLLPEFWNLAGANALQTVRYMDQIDPENTMTDDFRKKYAADGNDADQLTAYTIQGYDAVFLLADAFSKAQSDNGADLRDAMESATVRAHWGTDGYELVCSSADHRCASPAGLIMRRFDASGRPGEVLLRGSAQ